jgi:cyclopropane fatty-acyl-phospholipid synthase-like methyltransferase
VIDLGEQYLQGSFLKPGKETPSLRKIPTKLVRCDPTLNEKACGLLQTETSVPSSILYSAYWYRSGTNQTMRNHLQGIADEAVGLVNSEGARVLDIGCNDGTLLRCYPDSFVKFGVDPSDIAQEIDQSVTVIQDTFPSAELNSLTDGNLFDIITSIAMFYDLENPVAFVDQIKNVLSKEGIWIFEVSYMPSMLAMNSYDTICHEHLEYYSLSVIENIMQRCGMKVVKVGFNDINGGSIRCYVTHVTNFKFKNKKNQHILEQIRHQEFDLELDTDKPYKNFQDRINNHKEELSGLLKKLRREGKKIHIYGASTKGNTILQWCGLDSTIIDYAADRNPDKDGARTIGTDIPIISEEKSRSMKPDYYLVLPWHFRAEFLDREKAFLDQGGGFIFPLPAIEIVKH